ncbi:hypothetical protein FRX31_016643 [Thalictrum thalictroides]|uniref:Uncharacterized protein n=1 Tax=Thalictrum thalictroides TaxID=46969 RepID=A0A7J6WAY2_THATH|nr:hypothetical protein FRX31_016643 [Thalictrum thalictroides]
MGESGRENIGRERSDKMELDPSYPQNITANESIAGSDGGVALPQLKSNKRKTQSPNMFTKHVDYLEEEQLKIEIVAEKRHHTQVQELPENFT